MAKIEKAVPVPADAAPKYVAVHGGPMIDPHSGIAFDSDPKESALTGWLDFQIASGKIAAVAAAE
jgi:hypothetical protein